MDIRAFAMNMIENAMKNNPDQFKDQRSQEMINLIRSGDAQKGCEYASNLCNSYGESRDDAITRATQFFGIGGK